MGVNITGQHDPAGIIADGGQTCFYMGQRNLVVRTPACMAANFKKMWHYVLAIVVCGPRKALTPGGKVAAFRFSLVYQISSQAARCMAALHAADGNAISLHRFQKILLIHFGVLPFGTNEDGRDYIDLEYKHPSTRVHVKEYPINRARKKGVPPPTSRDVDRYVSYARRNWCVIESVADCSCLRTIETILKENGINVVVK